MKIQISTSTGRLKITKSDYAKLEHAVLAIVKAHPEAYQKYKAQGLSDMRYNWDVLKASKFPVTELYDYLNDSHINAALAKILKNSGKGKS